MVMPLALPGNCWSSQRAQLNAWKQAEWPRSFRHFSPPATLLGAFLSNILDLHVVVRVLLLAFGLGCVDSQLYDSL